MKDQRSRHSCASGLDQRQEFSGKAPPSQGKSSVMTASGAVSSKAARRASRRGEKLAPAASPSVRSTAEIETLDPQGRKLHEAHAVEPHEGGGMSA